MRRAASCGSRRKSGCPFPNQRTRRVCWKTRRSTAPCITACIRPSSGRSLSTGRSERGLGGLLHICKLIGAVEDQFDAVGDDADLEFARSGVGRLGPAGDLAGLVPVIERLAGELGLLALGQVDEVFGGQ